MSPTVAQLSSVARWKLLGELSPQRDRSWSQAALVRNMRRSVCFGEPIGLPRFGCDDELIRQGFDSFPRHAFRLFPTPIYDFPALLCDIVLDRHRFARERALTAALDVRLPIPRVVFILLEARTITRRARVLDGELRLCELVKARVGGD